MGKKKIREPYSGAGVGGFAIRTPSICIIVVGVLARKLSEIGLYEFRAPEHVRGCPLYSAVEDPISQY
jgi:hypothetical protein